MRRIIHGAGRLFENAAIAFLATLVFSIGAQIVMRNLFSSGSVALEELARFSLVSAVFLMVPVLALRRQHIIVDIILLQLPPGARRIFDLAIQAVCAAFGIFVLYAIYMIMQRNWNIRTPAMRMPNALFYLPVILGMLLYTFGSASNFIDAMKGAPAGGEEGK